MKTYLGDGVYAEVVDGMVRLTTEDGVRTTNEVFLDSHVLRSLLDWLRALGVKL